MARPPLIDFQNLTVIKTGGQKVLDRVSLNVREGENIAILGPNGAGKSSLIKLITREYYPYEAEPGFVFKISGEENWDLFALRSNLGIVSNDLQAICSREISGLEAVLAGYWGGIGLHDHKPSKALLNKTASLLEFLEIGHLRERTMTTLSSGEARRFLIARALIHDPKALILDESMTSLDLKAMHQFKALLRKIAKTGTSIILVTHHLDEIIPEIERVVLIKSGRIVADGAKSEILCESHVGSLFDVPVKMIRQDGYFYVLG